MSKKKADRTIFSKNDNSQNSFSLKLLNYEEINNLKKAQELLQPIKGQHTLSEELIRTEKAKEILIPIKEKYKLTFDDLKELLDEKLIQPKEEVSLPISIFNSKLTVLESVAKYLKEEKNLSLHEISRAIKRDERNIWHTYENAKKKHPEKLILENVKFWVPVSIFSDSKLSALETLVSHLKSQLNFSYHEIAVLLSRNDRTIWTVHSRSKKKYVK